MNQFTIFPNFSRQVFGIDKIIGLSILQASSFESPYNKEMQDDAFLHTIKPGVQNCREIVGCVSLDFVGTLKDFFLFQKEAADFIEDTAPQTAFEPQKLA